jgi:formate hydrogenlyase subunit 3/multisubunit Na+/H+ antiporter MnhD subunit
VSHGLISSLLFLLVGAVYANTGTRDLKRLRGLLNPERGLPLVGSLMVLGVMASGGTPGLVGFIAEFTLFRGSFPVFPLQTLLCMVGTGLTAAYFLTRHGRTPACCSFGLAGGGAWPPACLGNPLGGVHRRPFGQAGGPQSCRSRRADHCFRAWVLFVVTI